MTREERKDAIDIIQSILNKYEEDECLVTEITIGDEDIKAFKMAIKALEQEPSDKQRYVVRGINNDKIEFIDNYSVRAFNRYIKVIKDLYKYEVLDKIRAELIQSIQNGVLKIESGNEALFNILDKYKAESEGKK